ncbi:hypothetical protein [Desulfonatronovibrio magnus]|uniref:hypothetical protein n=1 Tax=Desulfonatronovibrio magnus TaxID=698827 RepID=UPI0005EBBA2A|nr:hypothetical protein [Desulfonatronovibrio magnus]
MNLQLKALCGLMMFLVLVMGSALPATADCGAGDGSYTQAARDLAPVTVIRGGETHNLSLVDAYEFLEHPCLTGTVSFLAAKYGFGLLFGEETPVIEDIVSISRAPGGSMGALDFIFKGDNPRDKTWPPHGIESRGDNFVYQFLRKSTMQAVTIRLKDEMWPSDWFELRAKQHAGTISEAQSKKRSQDRRFILENYPAMNFEDLFEVPDQYTFIAWGHIEKGEIDRRIRDQRRQVREQAQN